MSKFTRNDLKEWFRTTHASAQVEESENDQNLLSETMGRPRVDSDLRHPSTAPGNYYQGRSGEAIDWIKTGSRRKKPGSHMPGGPQQWAAYREDHIAQLTELIANYPDMADSNTAERHYWEDVVRQALKRVSLGV